MDSFAKSHDSARQRNRSIGRSLGLAALILGPATLYGLNRVGASWWLVDLASHFELYLLLPLSLGATWAFWRRRWLWGVAAVGVGLFASVPWSPYWRPLTPPPESKRAPLELVCFNINALNRTPERVLQYLLNDPPDAIALLEVTPRWRHALEALSTVYPFQHFSERDDYFGIALWSRLPETRIIERPHGAFGLPSLEAHFRHADQTVRWIAFHPPPPIRPLLYREQSRILDELGIQLASDPTIATIVSGDWNLTPFSHRFRRFLAERQLRDASVGHGFQPTWRSGPWNAIQLPIDHFLVSPHWTVLDERVEGRYGSDHHALRIHLAIGR